ncbi:hypothetical protein [Phycicoccus sp. Soil802]|uniref:hypothetical protein n=1 Tax=Phycicoccus sp. Soil802 TaxID=1736414 RepID=UPI000ADCBF7B|nr:hypothetical protein [Phycicoccus sp. Soil802]
MFAHRLRRTTVVAVVSAGLVLVPALPARAADATITVPQPGKFSTQDPFPVEGTCPEGSRTATVAVTSDDVEVAQTATDVADDLGFATVLDISKALTGTGRVTLACFAYSDQAPLGTAEVEVLLFGPDTADYEVQVSVSPRSVPLGGVVTVSATCDPGTEMSVVYLQVQFEASFPGDGFIFRQATVRPRPNGDVTVRLPISADHARGFTDPEVGPALVVLVCGDPEAQQPVRDGYGETEFTITAAAAPRPALSPTQGPELANTGSAPSGLVGLALLLLGTGLACELLGRRRPTEASR